MAKRYKELYSKYSKLIKMAQSSAISAAIQNMILSAEALGVGSCWLDTPLFCEKQINNYLGRKENLCAVLSLGYSNQKGSRSKRKPMTEAVEYVK